MDNMELTLGLTDWRRQMTELYAAVRANSDSEEAWRKWRVARDRLFASHSGSPRSDASAEVPKTLPFFEYGPAYRLLVEMEGLSGQELLSFDLGHQGLMTMLPVGRTRGLEPGLGGELTAYWICGYGGGLFVPFTDSTSGHETFGGGRYLLDGINGADLGMENGRTVLDFNFAYSPACAHSPTWICPLAPPENHLPSAIRAGERLVASKSILKQRA
jgi:hypothetical protein